MCASHLCSTACCWLPAVGCLLPALLMVVEGLKSSLLEAGRWVQVHLPAIVFAAKLALSPTPPTHPAYLRLQTMRCLMVTGAGATCMAGAEWTRWVVGGSAAYLGVASKGLGLCWPAFCEVPMKCSALKALRVQFARTSPHTFCAALAVHQLHPLASTPIHHLPLFLWPLAGRGG